MSEISIKCLLFNKSGAIEEDCFSAFKALLNKYPEESFTEVYPWPGKDICLIIRDEVDLSDALSNAWFEIKNTGSGSEMIAGPIIAVGSDAMSEDYESLKADDIEFCKCNIVRKTGYVPPAILMSDDVQDIR